MFEKAEMAAADGCSVERFELVSCSTVNTYVTVKHNHNQICWKYTKVRLAVVVFCFSYSVMRLAGFRMSTHPAACVKTQ
jgi:hypothetical protein